MMHSEITETAFNALIKGNTPPSNVEELEHARKATYYNSVLDVTCVIVNNYIGNISQYYIRDINA